MNIKRYALILALALALVAGFGCTKKGSGTDGDGGDGSATGSGQVTPEMQAAMDEISNNKIYFAFNSFDINSEGQRILNAKATKMQQFPSLRVQIQGHCDQRGTEEYNLALGEKRARAAHEYLSKLGVGANQMEIISYGKERPAVQGSGESVWQQNRRDEFAIIGY